MTPAHSQPFHLDGRSAAVLAVADALAGRGFVVDAVRAARRDKRLDDREAALAMEIGLGTIRHLITIEHVIGALARLDRARTPLPLRSILYTGVYQIIWMDRIPVSAAGDRAVEMARTLLGAGTPGFANAILRGVARAVVNRCTAWARLDPTQVRTSWDMACRFERPVLPVPTTDDAVARYLAAAGGETHARFRQLCARYGPDEAEAVTWASQAPPPTVLQRNALSTTAAAFADELRSCFGARVEIVGDAAYLAPGESFGGAGVFRSGRAYVQDTTAHRAAAAVAARPGERILDRCAAPGGKTVAMAIGMSDRGEVVACDSAKGRLALVMENARRLRLTIIRAELTPGSDSGLNRLGEFDAALVDVPCSNSGVIARRPESRLALTDAKLRSLTELQLKLLRESAGRVRRGGRLIYSTCSIEPEENGQVVAAFLADAPGWSLDEERWSLPTWGPRWSQWGDGGYYARLIHA